MFTHGSLVPAQYEPWMCKGVHTHSAPDPPPLPPVLLHPFIMFRLLGKGDWLGILELSSVTLTLEEASAHAVKTVGYAGSRDAFIEAACALFGDLGTGSKSPRLTAAILDALGDANVFYSILLHRSQGLLLMFGDPSQGHGPVLLQNTCPQGPRAGHCPGVLTVSKPDVKMHITALVMGREVEARVSAFKSSVKGTLLCVLAGVLAGVATSMWRYQQQQVQGA